MKTFIAFAGVLFLTLVSLTAHADLIKQSTAYTRYVYMQDSTASRSPGVAGLTLTITQSKAGGAFAAITPTVTDLGGGWYSLAMTSGMNDTLGARAGKIVATGADETDILDQIVAFDPADAAGLGLSRLDAAVSTRNAVAPDNTSVAAIKAQTDRLTFTGGNVNSAAQNLPTDYQQRGVAVTLPASILTNADVATIFNSAAGTYNGAGSLGAKLNAAGTAADPWSVPLPGAYGAGTAGYIVGNRLDAALSSRMATFGLPTNFSLLSIDGAGKTALTSAEHTLIQTDAATGVRGMTINGRTFAQLLTILGFNPAGTITSMTRSISAPWTITTVYTDGAATATYVSTFLSNAFSTQIGRPTVTFTGLP